MFPLALALLAVQFVATNAATTVTNYHNQTLEQCRTFVATSSATGNTSLATSTVSTTTNQAPRDYTMTTTPVVTLTPPESTSTRYVTKYVKAVVTASRNTNVASVTTTVVVTIATDLPQPTVTVVSTSTSTTTLTTLTATIHPDSWWIPIGKTRNTTYPSYRPQYLPKRDTRYGLHQLNGLRAELYPTSVICTESIVLETGVTTMYAANVTKTIILRAKTTAEVLNTTITTTSTIQPRNVTTTTTITAISTSTSTFTFATFTQVNTSTVTATLPTGVAILYAACAAGQRLGPIVPKSYPEVGNVIDDVLYNPSSQDLSTGYAASGYDCCLQCILTDDCAFGAWSTDSRVCYTQSDAAGTCGANMQGSQSGEYVSEPNNSSVDALEVFNGFCGYLYNGGAGY